MTLSNAPEMSKNTATVEVLFKNSSWILRKKLLNCPCKNGNYGNQPEIFER